MQSDHIHEEELQNNCHCLQLDYLPHASWCNQTQLISALFDDIITAEINWKLDCFKLFLIASLVSCVFSQAPGDGDSLCVDPLVDIGIPSRFAIRSLPCVRPILPTSGH